MAYEAKAIANEFIRIAGEEKRKLTPMQVLKLVYFAHGWHLALTDGEPLINEFVEAWEYGPVIPSVYHEFKKFGKNHITEEAVGVRYIGARVHTFPYCIDESAPSPDADFVRRLLKRIWMVYGKLTGFQLSNITHEPNSPWDRARKNTPYFRGIDIDNKLIQEYFYKKLKA